MGHLGTHASELQRLGKPGTAKIELHDLRKVVSETVGMLRNVGFLKRVRLKVELPEVPVSVYADRMRLEQVLINLVKNAADAVASNRGKPREISVEVEDESYRGWAFATVADNGIGIPEEDLEAIFEPYFTRKNKDEGTGLGLPVCRQIMEEIGGRLRVSSQEGVGTAFTFSLPVARTDPSMAGKVTAASS